MVLCNYTFTSSAASRTEAREVWQFLVNRSAPCPHCASHRDGVLPPHTDGCSPRTRGFWPRPRPRYRCQGRRRGGCPSLCNRRRRQRAVAWRSRVLRRWRPRRRGGGTAWGRVARLLSRPTRSERRGPCTSPPRHPPLLSVRRRPTHVPPAAGRRVLASPATRAVGLARRVSFRGPRRAGDGHKHTGAAAGAVAAAIASTVTGAGGPLDAGAAARPRRSPPSPLPAVPLPPSTATSGLAPRRVRVAAPPARRAAPARSPPRTAMRAGWWLPCRRPTATMSPLRNGARWTC